MADDQTGSQNAPNDTETTTQGDDTPQGDQTSQSDTETSQQGQENDASKNDTVTRAEFERVMERMKAADRAKAAAEEKAKKLEREKMSDLERVKAEAQDAIKSRELLEQQLSEIRLENAFLSNNKYTWVDPSDALKLLDSDGVEVKDGKVEGMNQAIEKLAKAKPHLLKKDDGDGEGSSAASGSASNGTRKGDKRSPKKDYSSRFPALRR